VHFDGKRILIFHSTIVATTFNAYKSKLVYINVSDRDSYSRMLLKTYLNLSFLAGTTHKKQKVKLNRTVQVSREDIEDLMAMVCYL
jgi:hypothetical protein